MDKRVVEKMIVYFSEKYANPSSIYSFSQKTKMEIEEARQKVAKIINGENGKIIFTGGGTEADNLAIKGVAFQNRDKGKHIITTKIEHHAVLHSCEYLEKYHNFEITYLPVNSYGIVDIEA